MGSNLILVGKDILCYTELHSQIYSQTEKGSFHVSNSKKNKSEALKSEEAIQEITREEIKRNRLIALGILIAAAAGICPQILCGSFSIYRSFGSVGHRKRWNLLQKKSSLI